MIPSLAAGGIGSVCRYAAEAIAQSRGWRVCLVSLHDEPESSSIEGSVSVVCLGLATDIPKGFLKWLIQNPQDVVITNDVSRLEPGFETLYGQTRHIIQVHDSLRRYRAAAIRNAAWTDGVICVAQHIEEKIRPELQAVGYKKFVKSIHNGAIFPPPGAPKQSCPSVQLLFMGRIDPIKGAWDLTKILIRLRKRGVNFRLTIVGGTDDKLARKFERLKLDADVNWVGHVPHEECYSIAAKHDVFLMLSRKEPFGMVTIETMAMGCVPVAYDTPSGTTEIIENTKDGILVPLGNYDALADAIHRLSCDPSLRSRMSLAAIAKARTKFDAVAVAEDTADFIALVAASRSLGQNNMRLPDLGLDYPHRQQRVFGYHNLPDSIRKWVRTTIHAHPKLSHWVLSR